METDTSRSKSIIASISVKDPLSTLLIYEYQNEPIPGAIATMHIHKGTARLLIQEGGKVLVGEYYTGRDRQSYGVLNFRKI